MNSGDSGALRDSQRVLDTVMKGTVETQFSIHGIGI